MYYSLILYFSLLLSSSSFVSQEIRVDEILANSQTTSQYGIENDNTENGVEKFSAERRKKIIDSAVVVSIIIIVALTPKMLLIYGTMKKSKKKKTKSQIDFPIKNESKQDLYFDDMRDLVIKNDPMFFIKFRNAYPHFAHNILIKHPDLIKSELTLCAMIYLNFSAKEIAEYTFIQHRSVQTNRSRLRKKMKLSSQLNLDQYIRSFNQ